MNHSQEENDVLLLSNPASPETNTVILFIDTLRDHFYFILQIQMKFSHNIYTFEED
jgi:hypothetical protein